MGSLPTGTVTFLFSDVEGSTELVQRLGDRYGDVLGEHREIVRAEVAHAGGEIVDARGEECFVAFPSATDAAAAAIAIQRAHSEGVMRVRIGLHTGEPALSGDGYLGLDVHRAARVCAAGHGGQVVLSQATRDLLPAFDARDLGEHRLQGIADPERIFQLLAPGLSAAFPPLRVAVVRRGRLAEVVARLGTGRRHSLEELGWEVRGRMPGADEQTRTALAELGARLLSASRSLNDADRLLALVDRRLLRRRLREHEELGTLSRHARERAAVIQRQLDDVDAVAQRRTQLAEVARGVGVRLPLAAVVGLTDRIENAATALSAALERAQADLDEGTWRLRRTPHPGVYRAADRYAVPSVDEAGVERVATFRTCAEARSYRRAQRLREKTFSTSHQLDSYHGAAGRRDMRDPSGNADAAGFGDGGG